MLEGTALTIIKIIFYLALLGIPLYIGLLIYRKNLESQKLEWFSRLRFVVLRILVPKNNEKTPLAAEQMFAALHGIFRAESEYQEYISFEIAARDKYIQFYVAVPSHLKEFVQGQIYAQYPVAEISEVDDYTMDEAEKINSGELKLCGADLNLVNDEVFPIKSFVNFEVDPLSAITGVLSRLERDEQFWIQILVKPVSDDWQSKGNGYIKAVKSGTLKSKGLGKMLFETFIHALMAIIGAIVSNNPGTTAKAEAPKEPKLSSSQEAGLKGIENKITKLGYNTKIRLLALAPNENVAQAKVMSVVGAFKQFNILNLNGFTAGSTKNSPEYWQQYNERRFMENGYILNTEELASIYHLPSISVQTPNIVWAGAKKGEPPSNLPISENVPEDELTVLGKTNFRHMSHQFGIKLPDRRYHMYVIGQTGVGKSTLLENMAIDDIKMGRGLAVVDPHGDLINHILDYIPEERIKDVVIFSPSDRQFPVAFNPLENVDPDMKNNIASGVVGIFKKIFGESWGPRLEYILRNTILALLDYPNATLLSVTRLLVDKPFREKVVAQIKDPVIKDFFVNEFEQYDPKFRTEAVAPIQNKVGQFLSSSTIRNIIGQPKSTIDLKNIMDTGKIFLVNLSIGEIGEDASQLLGALMITKIQLAAMQRATVKEEDRRDFYLYVDEFQNFATDSFAVILSEARKYHLNLIMTHQYIAQMPDKVREAVFGNVGSTISFRVGAPDAPILEKVYEPIFTANDLLNLPNHHIYVKMNIDGVTSQGFSAATLPRSAELTNNREKILEFSRQHFSRPREEVETQIGETVDMPKVDEILTKSEKKLVVKLPPKIGDVYYREVQAPGDERWYLGGGTTDQPLDEETVKEKVAKTEERAKMILEKKIEEGEPLSDWQKERLDALEVHPSENPDENLAGEGDTVIEEIKTPETPDSKEQPENEITIRTQDAIEEKPLNNVMRVTPSVLQQAQHHENQTAILNHQPLPTSSVHQEFNSLPQEELTQITPIMPTVEHDHEFEKDKEALLASLSGNIKDAKPLEDGEVIKVEE